MTEDLLIKAGVALKGDEYLEFEQSVRDETFNFVGITKKAFQEAELWALESIYKGDCDFVVFDHYKKCKDLKDAVKKYEDNDN